MISHGSARFLKERLMDVSDKYKVYVCDHCGLICEANLNHNTFQCRGCKERSRISGVDMPYASKLLFQELMALMIAPRIMTGSLRKGECYN
jgi:DNA-directed RNA polymerase II subunit RPB2